MVWSQGYGHICQLKYPKWLSLSPTAINNKCPWVTAKIWARSPPSPQTKYQYYVHTQKNIKYNIKKAKKLFFCNKVLDSVYLFTYMVHLRYSILTGLAHLSISTFDGLSTPDSFSTLDGFSKTKNFLQVKHLIVTQFMTKLFYKNMFSVPVICFHSCDFQKG